MRRLARASATFINKRRTEMETPKTTPERHRAGKQTSGRNRDETKHTRLFEDQSHTTLARFIKRGGEIGNREAAIG